VKARKPATGPPVAGSSEAMTRRSFIDGGFSSLKARD
jgi:hypothetical protein